MTLTLELSPALEAALLQEARERGLSAAEVATELLADLLQDREDLAIARERLSELKASGGQTVSWEQLKAETGL